MKAIRLHRTGGPEVLVSEEVQDPTPGYGEALVRPVAVGVNFIDTYHRSGAYPVQLPAIPGLEGSGVVVEVGTGVERIRPGARVAWPAAMGSYAELVRISADRLVPVPDDVDHETAAALMLQGMTAHYLVHSTYDLKEDQWALVYAAAGGVGRLLVQLARLRGARVIACTSTREKAEEVQALGATQVILYREVSVPERVREVTDGAGVDVVYDSVGRDTFESSLESLRPRGLMVLFGQSSGKVPPIDPQTLNDHGSLFLTRPSLFHYIRSSEELETRATEILRLAGSGNLEVRIFGRYPLPKAAEAHTDLESGRTSGKLLLLPDPTG